MSSFIEEARPQLVILISSYTNKIMWAYFPFYVDLDIHANPHQFKAIEVLMLHLFLIIIHILVVLLLN